MIPEQEASGPLFGSPTALAPDLSVTALVDEYAMQEGSVINFSPRLKDEPLASVLKEDLCRTGRFRIQRDPTFPKRDSGVLG
jgi:hypothetical protein